MPVHLLREAASSVEADYLALNPGGAGAGCSSTTDVVLTQSLAIMRVPRGDAPAAAAAAGTTRSTARTVRAMALAIACEIHPLNNLRVLRYLRDELGQDEAAVNALVPPLDRAGASRALERSSWRATRRTAAYCFGDVGDARRRAASCRRCTTRAVPVSICRRIPRLVAASAHLQSLPAFAAARPEAQPDAQPDGK
ncbi:MAG: hypothetical protein MZV65_42245 [Chromatiales bacterium]|nr:hypothetical protein [Chromatiales bacterium]